MLPVPAALYVQVKVPPSPPASAIFAGKGPDIFMHPPIPVAIIAEGDTFIAIAWPVFVTAITTLKKLPTGTLAGIT